MDIEFGWHNVNDTWLLGSRSVGDQEVKDPVAEVEKVSGIWYWKIYGTRFWGTCARFGEAIYTVHATMTQAARVPERIA